ncbi:Uncharacterised protein [Chlamydia trachomatis]|nr:Uncharacterised protein [Chlamydia trachomatis]
MTHVVFAVRFCLVHGRKEFAVVVLRHCLIDEDEEQATSFSEGINHALRVISDLIQSHIIFVEINVLSTG